MFFASVAVDPLGQKADASVLLEQRSIVFRLPTFIDFEGCVAAFTVVIVTVVSDHQSAAKVALENELVLVRTVVIAPAVEDLHCFVYKSWDSKVNQKSVHKGSMPIHFGHGEA